MSVLEGLLAVLGLTLITVLTRGFFAGASLEAGNAWVNHRDISLRNLLVGSSVFLGADTGVGPMYLGLTWAARGTLGLVFFIGRP